MPLQPGTPLGARPTASTRSSFHWPNKYRRRPQSSSIPATRPRCAALARQRTWASSFPFWLARSQKLRPSPSNMGSISLVMSSSTGRTVRWPQRQVRGVCGGWAREAHAQDQRPDRWDRHAAAVASKAPGSRIDPLALITARLKRVRISRSKHRLHPRGDLLHARSRAYDGNPSQTLRMRSVGPGIDLLRGSLLEFLHELPQLVRIDVADREVVEAVRAPAADVVAL
jgi:hypothetical protein